MNHTPKRHGRGRLRSALVRLCLGMLLLSTTAAAAHFDELASLPLNTRTSVAALMSGPTFCVICAVAHSPSAAAPVVSVAPGVRYADRSVIAPIQSKSYLQVFRLDVRPPPAA